MKRTIIIAMALTLMASLFVGCGCQNVSDRVDGMITEATELLPSMTTDPTRDTSRPTQPSTAATRPTDGRNPTTDSSGLPDNGNGGAGDWMDPTETTNNAAGSAPTDMTRSRNRMDSRS